LNSREFEFSWVSTRARTCARQSSTRDVELRRRRRRGEEGSGRRGDERRWRSGRRSSDGDDGVGEDEILSDDDDLDEYLKEVDELVMSPRANVSNRTEMTSLGNLDETVLVQDDVSQPARNKPKETFAQKAARKALERQEKERRSKSRRLKQ
jgi:hypothetical protein